MPLSVSISGPAGKPGQVYYPLVHNRDPAAPTPQGSELLLHMRAAALNHRDHFIRQHLYPGTTFAPVPLGADGCGVVISTGPDIKESEKQSWLGKRVVVNPGTGWESDPVGPEEDGPTGGNYLILGGTKFYPKGTMGEYLVVESSEVELAPEHLSDVEAAALPLTGLTAWRAVGPYKLGERNSGEGKDVLVTGIGGGVALMALVILKAKGTRVWVTSGSQEKLDKATKELGAAGGVNYKEEGWEGKLLELVKQKNGGKKKLLDGIVDGAGGDIGNKAFKLLRVSLVTFFVISMISVIATCLLWTSIRLTISARPWAPFLLRFSSILPRPLSQHTRTNILILPIQTGSPVVSYGMTVRPTISVPMQGVLKQIEFRGSTMGSRQEFRDLIKFFSDGETKPKPVVSRVVKGIEDLGALNGLWEDMKNGIQFGKLVVVISEGEGDGEGKGSKL